MKNYVIILALVSFLSFSFTQYSSADNKDEISDSGWVAKDNYFETYPNIGQIYKVKLIDNNTRIFIGGANNSIRIFDMASGKLEYSHSFPDSMNVKYYDVIDSDSLLLMYYDKDFAYHFGLYSINNQTFTHYFTLTRDEVISYVDT